MQGYRHVGGGAAVGMWQQLLLCHLFSSKSLRSCMQSREREAGCEREW